MSDMAVEFQAFPKIYRFFRNVTVTEKIDGTNAAIHITPEGDLFTQSRKRMITPADDNFGFAKWAYDRKDELVTLLGPGLHFGEWWGSGIQRRYGLDEKRFSLFNTTRWGHLDGKQLAGVHSVPVLYEGEFINDLVWKAIADLNVKGSKAAPGFDKQPEGVVIFHHSSNSLFKYTFGGDGHKGDGSCA